MCERLHSCKTLKAGCAMVCDGKDLDDVKARIADPLLDYDSVYILKYLSHYVPCIISLSACVIALCQGFQSSDCRLAIEDEGPWI